VHRPWEPPGWTELGDLCASGPFRVFCGTDLPTSDQRLICAACGHGATGMDPRSTSLPHGSQPWAEALHRPAHPWPHIPPEQQHEQMGLPAWEAPYVWETHYF